MTPVRVLFLCTGNSCRSQMAEALLREISGNDFDASSAGINPSRVNPIAIRVMSEIGIDMTGQRSKSINVMRGQRFDYVITVCDNARAACPVFGPAQEQLHWSFDDPAQATGTEDQCLAVFRKVRDSIAERVKEFASKRIQASRLS